MLPEKNQKVTDIPPYVPALILNWIEIVETKSTPNYVRERYIDLLINVSKFLTVYCEQFRKR